MGRLRQILGALVAVLALAAAACGNEEPTVAGSPTASPAVRATPEVTIGACHTNPGTQQPAEPKNVDFKSQLKEQGLLNVGSDNDFPPFESIPPGKKEPVGFDVDLYKEIARLLGLRAKSTTTSFDALFTQSLPTGQFDVGISGITIKEERKRKVDFTIPYFISDLSLAVNVKRTPDIRSVDDLAGKVIGAQTGTTGEDCAKALVEMGKAKAVKSFDNTGPAFDDLVSGRIAAVVNDRPASEGFIEQRRPTLDVVQIIKTNEKYGIAVGKQKPDLRVNIDEVLRRLFMDGTYASIYKRWFRTEPPFKVPIEE